MVSVVSFIEVIIAFYRDSIGFRFFFFPRKETFADERKRFAGNFSLFLPTVAVLPLLELRLPIILLNC